ncbi:MAG: hypothetical protein WCJ92_06665 [Alphaproteobacteria bacterium]
MFSKKIFRCFLFLFLIFSKNIEAGANIELEETRANTIRALSVTQAVAAGVLFILPWNDNALCETTSNLTSLLGVTCGVADLLHAVYFPVSRDKNKSINPYLVFGFIEMLISTCCFGNEFSSWLGALALVYCGAERFCMAPLLAERRYVVPF